MIVKKVFQKKKVLFEKVFFPKFVGAGRRNGTEAEGWSGVEAPPRRQTFENKTFCEQNFFSHMAKRPLHFVIWDVKNTQNLDFHEKIQKFQIDP